MSRRLHQVLIGGVSCSTNENAEMGVMRCRRKKTVGRGWGWGGGAAERGREGQSVEVRVENRRGLPVRKHSSTG